MSIILNTTFHLDSALTEEFLGWVRSRYLPSALASGLLHTPSISRLMVQVAEGADGFAVQLKADSSTAASEWHDGEGDRLRRELSSNFGDRMVFFTTLMEELPVE